MITKGYIIEKSSQSPFKYKVRMPIFENAGMQTSNSIYDATVCYSAGNINAFKSGDCVFIGFENNNLANPIILGKLFLGEEETATNSSFANGLKITSWAQLPENTTIGGLKLQTLINDLQQLKNIADIISAMKNSTIIVSNELPQAPDNPATLWLNTGYDDGTGATVTEPVLEYYVTDTWIPIAAVWK